MNGHVALLPEPPEPAHRLIILLIAVIIEVGARIAVLPVNAKCSDFRFRNEIFDLTGFEGEELFLFRFILIRTGKIDGARDRLREIVSLRVKMASCHAAIVLRQ